MPQALSIIDSRQSLGGISQAMIYKLIKEGQLRSFKIGARRFISIEEIKRFIAEQEAKTEGKV